MKPIDYKARIEKAMEKADHDMKFYIREAKKQKYPFELANMAESAKIEQYYYYSLKQLLEDKFMGFDMNKETIKDLISWAEEQEKCGQEVIDNCLDLGWGDSIEEIQEEKERFRQIGAALKELLRYDVGAAKKNLDKGRGRV
jgi:hypothetical protein